MKTLYYWVTTCPSGYLYQVEGCGDQMTLNEILHYADHYKLNLKQNPKQFQMPEAWVEEQ